MELQNKVLIVTGGASGLGKATALMMGKAGASVVVSDINTVQGEEVTQAICADGGDAIFVKANTVNAAEVEALVNTTVDKFGKLDGAFNNAGVAGQLTPLHETSEDDFDRIMNVNVKGVWWCMKYELPHMIKQQNGVIVNMASAAGLIGARLNGAYSASKHAVVGLTRTGSQEYARYNIRINAVCPGFVETPMVTDLEDQRAGIVNSFARSIPLGRLGRPEEVASAVVWLCSDGASFVNGAILSIDGGIVSG